MDSRQVQFMTITGDRRLNEIMHAFDLRPHMKVFATSRMLVLTGTATEQEMFDLLKDKLAESFVLVYLHCINHSELVFRDEKVQCISDGQHIYSLDQMLQVKGYPDGRPRSTTNHEG